VTRRGKKGPITSRGEGDGRAFAGEGVRSWTGKVGAVDRVIGYFLEAEES